MSTPDPIPAFDCVILTNCVSFFIAAIVAAPQYPIAERSVEGLDLAGSTQNTLALTNLQPVDEGDYTVVITNVAGAVTSEAARLWVVPLASEFVKSNLTNQAGVRLPYFYLLPTNYTVARRYPLLLYFHGMPGDETLITTPGYGYPGYAEAPSLKVFASCRQQEADPMILLWPVRRAGEAYDDWSSQYLQLASNLLDQFLTEYSVDTNRVYVSRYSQGVKATWDLMGMRPDFFAGAAVAAAVKGALPLRPSKMCRFGSGAQGMTPRRELGRSSPRSAGQGETPFTPNTFPPAPTHISMALAWGAIIQPSWRGCWRNGVACRCSGSAPGSHGHRHATATRSHRDVPPCR